MTGIIIFASAQANVWGTPNETSILWSNLFNTDNTPTELLGVTFWKSMYLKFKLLDFKLKI